MNNNVRVDFYNSEGEWSYSEYFSYKPEESITPTFMKELTDHVRELNNKGYFGHNTEEYIVVTELQSGLSRLTRWVAPNSSIHCTKESLMDALTQE